MSENALPPLRDVIRTHGIRARKKLGQNFILDSNLTDKIARAAGPLEGINVLEVGAGPGGLTRSLLREGAAQVVSIECDLRAIEALEILAQQHPNRLRIIAGDALKQDYTLCTHQDYPTRIVANLPYNIATPLLVQWLTNPIWPPFFDRMILMLQREFAERITAPPGGRNYGRISILSQWRCQTRILFPVPRTAFTPAPKVESALVSFIPHANPIPCQHHNLESVTSAAFGQRRKMLRSSLRKLFSGDIVQRLESVNINPLARPETLDIADFCTLARMLEAEPIEKKKPSPPKKASAKGK